MGVFERINKSNEDTDKKLEKYVGTIELVAAILIGISTILGAFSAYQSALYGGSCITKYNKGVALINEANADYVYNNQIVMEDVMYWMHLTEYKTLAKGSDPEVSKRYEDLAKRLEAVVPYELIEAIDWAEEENSKNPYKEQVVFYNYKNYISNLNKYADKLLKKGNAMISDGQMDNSLGDQQTLVTVIFAVVLFLGSMVSAVKRNLLKVIFFACMNIMFVYAVIRLFQVPFIS